MKKLLIIIFLLISSFVNGQNSSITLKFDSDIIYFNYTVTDTISIYTPTKIVFLSEKGKVVFDDIRYEKVNETTYIPINISFPYVQCKSYHVIMGTKYNNIPTNTVLYTQLFIIMEPRNVIESTIYFEPHLYRIDYKRVEFGEAIILGEYIDNVRIY